MKFFEKINVIALFCYLKYFAVYVIFQWLLKAFIGHQQTIPKLDKLPLEWGLF